MKSVDKKKYDILLSVLFQWFEENKRPLPWRKQYLPYEVWISEMMLQQTQMERGVAYFLRWMEKFSSVSDVAKASEGEILQAWEGLGYYSRAKNLHKAAKIICEKYKGEIPCDYDTLLALPGIGPYTVAAIMGIAFEKDFATVDANVERVFSRLCNITDTNLKARVTEEVNRILPKGKARIFNQALMEFGALLCKKVPLCDKCPLCNFCEAFIQNVQNERPIPKKKTDIIPVYAAFCIIKHKEKGYLMRQRPHKGLWANMWEFFGLDTFMLDQPHKKNNVSFLHAQHNVESFARSLIRQELKKIFSYDVHTRSAEHNGNDLHDTYDDHVAHVTGVNFYDNFYDNKGIMIKHSYTNHRLQAYFFYKEITFDILLPQGYTWLETLEDVALPAHHRKAFEKKFWDIVEST